MARIRSVHPGLFTDEAFATVSPLARLLWIGIWTEADDQGAFEWKPVTLKMRILPVDAADVPALLAELEQAGMVRRYSVEARHYGAVRNFGRFQRPKKPNAVHPMPDEFRTYAGSTPRSSEPDDDEEGDGSGSAPPSTQSSSPPVPHQYGTGGEIPPQMEDGGGREEEEGKRRTPLTPRKRGAASPLAGFDEFWAHYPRRVSRGAAERAWPKALQAAGGDPEPIIAGVKVGLALGRFDMREDGRFCPHPATWLNGKRWLDGMDPEPEQQPSMFRS